MKTPQDAGSTPATSTTTTLGDESTARVRIYLMDILYGAVCQDRLEKGCLMDLFLMMDTNSSNSAMMAWNGPNFSFDSIAKRPFGIN